jgi:hypothetical protein
MVLLRRGERRRPLTASERERGGEQWAWLRGGSPRQLDGRELGSPHASVFVPESVRESEEGACEEQRCESERKLKQKADQKA